MAEMPDVVTLTTISSNWGNQLRDRTVQRYSSVANRTTEHPSPAEGDLSYLEDSKDVDVYNGTAWQHLGAPSGSMQMFAGSSVPDGWLLCNGQAVSRTIYAALFGQISTTWGVGDGSTTFNVPDMRGRLPRGVAASGTGNVLGGSIGLDQVVDHTHSGPSHNHTADPINTISGNPTWAQTLETNSDGQFVQPVESAGASTGASGIGLASGSVQHFHGTNEGVLAHYHSITSGVLAHTHFTNILQFNTGSSGTGETDVVSGTNPEQIPASNAVNFIIKT